MLDIIIPVYNDKKNLIKTILSIEPYNNKYHITIVNDASTKENYEDIVERFNDLYNIYLINLEKNVGPGLARQEGINNTNHQYIMFLDCGDKILSPYVLPRMFEIMKDYPSLGMISSQHFAQWEGDLPSENIVPTLNNRIHGKMYSRSFIDKHKITWCKTSSYCNEDIGWNDSIRWVGKSVSEKICLPTVYHLEEPTAIWVKDENSLTTKDDGVFIFREQNTGLSLNAIHIVKILEENEVSDNIIKDFIYETIVSLYFYYALTITYKPEFEKEAFNGMLIFYKEFYKKYFKNLDLDLLSNFYVNSLYSFLNDFESIRNNILKLDIINCLNKLNSYLLDNLG